MSMPADLFLFFWLVLQSFLDEVLLFPIKCCLLLIRLNCWNVPSSPYGFFGKQWTLVICRWPSFKAIGNVVIRWQSPGGGPKYIRIHHLFFCGHLSPKYQVSGPPFPEITTTKRQERKSHPFSRCRFIFSRFIFSGVGRSQFATWHSQKTHYSASRFRVHRESSEFLE